MKTKELIKKLQEHLGRAQSVALDLALLFEEESEEYDKLMGLVVSVENLSTDVSRISIGLQQ